MEWIDEFFKVISIYLSSLRWKSIVHANTHTNVGNNNPVLFFYLLTSSLSPLYLRDKPLSPPNEQGNKISRYTQFEASKTGEKFSSRVERWIREETRNRRVSYQSCQPVVSSNLDSLCFHNNHGNRASWILPASWFLPWPFKINVPLILRG